MNVIALTLSRPGLWATPLLLIGAILVVLVLVLLVYFWRQSFRLELERACQTRMAAWERVLTQSRTLYEQLQQDPNMLVRTARNFQNRSKIEYDLARVQWSAWLSQRQALEEILAQVRTLYAEHNRPKVWQFSTRSLQKAFDKLTLGRVEIDSRDLRSGEFSALAGLADTTMVRVDRLPESVRHNIASVSNSLMFLNTAVRNSQEAAAALQAEIAGDPSRFPDSIESSQRMLEHIGLPLTPYNQRLTELAKDGQALAQSLLLNPLTNMEVEVGGIRGRIIALKRDLDMAVQKHNQLSRLSARLESTTDLVNCLRATPVPCGFPGLELEGNWTLSEEDKNPDCYLAQGRLLLQELNQFLREGSLLNQDELEDRADQALRLAVQMVDQIVAEKDALDQEAMSITRDSLMEDRQADEEYRRVIAVLYAGQKWAAARQSMEPLRHRHEQRQAARLAVSSLLEQFSSVGHELQEHAAIVPTQIDEIYSVLLAQSEGLRHEASQGWTDWAVLHNRVNSALEQLLGQDRASVRSRIDKALSQYYDALAAVNKLSHELAHIEAKINENWGGSRAVELFNLVKPQISQVLSRSSQPKLDWLQLKQLAQDALESMAPASRLVEAELDHDRSFFAILSSFEKEYISCSDGATYRRIICGEEFGVGVYCPTNRQTIKLEEARASYHLRQYEQMLEAVQTARLELARSHLETWWLCLQSMSLSGDPCAVQFAWRQGYAEGRYEQWIAEHLDMCEKGAFYNPAPINCNNHRARSFIPPLVGDYPCASDYLGA